MHGPSKRKQHHQKRKTQPNKRTQSKPSDFHKKSMEAAIAQSKLAKANQRQRQFSHLSRVQLDTSQFANNKSIEVINLVSVSSQGSHVTIYTSHDPTTLMTTPSKKKLKNPAHTNRKIDKKFANSATHRQNKYEKRLNNPSLSPKQTFHLPQNNSFR